MIGLSSSDNLLNCSMTGCAKPTGDLSVANPLLPHPKNPWSQQGKAVFTSAAPVGLSDEEEALCVFDLAESNQAGKTDQIPPVGEIDGLPVRPTRSPLNGDYSRPKPKGVQQIEHQLDKFWASRGGRDYAGMVFGVIPRRPLPVVESFEIRNGVHTGNIPYCLEIVKYPRYGEHP